jgi:hypothetical protein
LTDKCNLSSMGKYVFSIIPATKVAPNKRVRKIAKTNHFQFLICNMSFRIIDFNLPPTILQCVLFQNRSWLSTQVIFYLYSQIIQPRKRNETDITYFTQRDNASLSHGVNL